MRRGPARRVERPERRPYVEAALECRGLKGAEFRDCVRAYLAGRPTARRSPPRTRPSPP